MDKNIQAMPLGRGDAVSPYDVQQTDDVVEFVTAGSVTVTPEVGAPTTTTVLAGSRYSITNGTKTITFGGKFSIG